MRENAIPAGSLVLVTSGDLSEDYRVNGLYRALVEIPDPDALLPSRSTYDVERNALIGHLLIDGILEIVDYVEWRM